MADILRALEETEKTKGCFLISGYRGSGKTLLISKVLAYYRNGKRSSGWMQGLDADNFEVKINNAIKEIEKAEASKWFIESISGDWKGNVFEEINNHLHTKSANGDKKNTVVVKINLAQDEELSTKSTLVDVVALLYREVKEGYYSFWTRVRHLIAFSMASLVTDIVLHIGVLECFDKNHTPGFLSSIDKILRYFGEINNVPILTFALAFVFLYSLIEAIWKNLKTKYGVYHLIKDLDQRILHSVEAGLSGRSLYGIMFLKKQLPLDARQIESELIYILKKGREVSIGSRLDVIFVFDELDKIAQNKNELSEKLSESSVDYDLKQRKQQLDKLLGALKNFITYGRARFFFIAGREMLDSYQSERGSTSSLYESLFQQIFAVPSLLTDPSDGNKDRAHSLIEVYVCRKLLDPDIASLIWLKKLTENNDLHKRYEKEDTDDSDSSKGFKSLIYTDLQYTVFSINIYYRYLLLCGVSVSEAQRIIISLRNFIQFLTLHSWGNPKRLNSLFYGFVKTRSQLDVRCNASVKKMSITDETIACIQFGLIDQQRIALASNLYTQLYHAIGRQIANSGDKLAVSTMAAHQYILKYHRNPFGRYHLDTLSEAINVYKSPELRTMIDTLLSKVLLPFIRNIRSSHYRYRFTGYFEQEIRYISRVSDIESAAFNFSLDASSRTKAHYMSQLEEALIHKKDGLLDSWTIFELSLYVGDLYASELSLNEALTYYQLAVDVLDQDPVKRNQRYLHLYVEVLLRKGEIFEARQSYDQASSVYLKAIEEIFCHFDSNWKRPSSPCRFPQDNFELKLSDSARSVIFSDSKRDIFRQPFWAYFYLHLKRSPGLWKNKLPVVVGWSDPVNNYKLAQLLFYFGNYEHAVEQYEKVLSVLNRMMIMKGFQKEVTI